jgi:hypothetical protein
MLIDLRSLNDMPIVRYALSWLTNRRDIIYAASAHHVSVIGNPFCCNFDTVADSLSCQPADVQPAKRERRFRKETTARGTKSRHVASPGIKLRALIRAYCRMETAVRKLSRPLECQRRALSMYLTLQLIHIESARCQRASEWLIVASLR